MRIIFYLFCICFLFGCSGMQSQNRDFKNLFDGDDWEYVNKKVNNE